ncbi:hypothetical protein [Eubacterium sp. 1001713B170207_170306_E7]|uniref:hypothetical protein n=1 Tax=Eubacterium sp. 1001713B170207_170306_E7 TaxID=2787097 RepID=UPI001897F2A7|nr:hypothetical protein [Eubacterium sp. 1001713B170207_170306_E7]
MNKKLSLVVAMFIILFFSIILLVTAMLKIPLGCWLLEGHSNDYITLNSDNTFESTVYGNGTFIIQEHEIILHGNVETKLTVIRKPLRIMLYDRQSDSYFYYTNELEK